MRKVTSYLVTFLLANILTIAAVAQNVTINGNVRNSSNRDAAGAVSVIVKGQDIGTFTDDKGNFRVSIFNESNSYSVIQDKNVGQFTQGVGLQYKEQFHNYRDFRVLQVFLDFFRKDKHIKFTKKRRQKAVPK